MKKYELLLILPGTLDDKEAEEKLATVVGMVQENAEQAESHFLGKTRLAYPIKQIRYGYHYAVTFTTDTSRLKVIEEKIRLSRDILRGFVSHFNTSAANLQKVAYTTNAAGITTMSENAAGVPAEVAEVAAAPAAEGQLNIDQINKKLDDIMSGSVVPGV